MAKHGRVVKLDPSKGISIVGIARLAGVTKSTVSKVLNNYSGVHEDTRKKIRKIVEEMGYQPNSAAKMLASRKTESIGLVIPHAPETSLDSAYWSSLVSAVAKESSRCGYTLSLLLPREEVELHELFTSIVRKRMVDGLIVGAELLVKRDLATLLYAKTPFVMLGKNPQLGHHCVDIDNRAAGAAIARYMLTRGYKRPLFVGGPSQYYYMSERAAGFAQELEAAGHHALAPLFFAYDGHQEMRRALMEKVPRFKPDSAVIGAGDYFMFSALSIFSEIGLRFPDFGFASFDDEPVLDFLTPPITAVKQPMAEMGREAVKMLTDLISSAGEEPADRVSILPTTIVSRKSCGEN